MPTDDNMLSAKEAAHFLRVHVETIRRMARRGDIPTYKLGKLWRVPKDALIEWAEARHDRQPSPLILVVDDEESFRRSIGECLRHGGFRVAMAACGEEALDLMRDEQPDLVFLDLVMPRMSGVDVLRELHRLSPDLPVVVVTGYPDSKLMAQALCFPPVTMLAKPVARNDLFRTISRVLHGVKPGTAGHSAQSGGHADC